jgi:hypothetical protein
MLANGQLIFATRRATGATDTHLLKPAALGSPSEKVEYYQTLCGRSVARQPVWMGRVLSDRQQIALEQGDTYTSTSFSVEQTITCSQCLGLYKVSE